MDVVKLGDVARESRLKWSKSKQDVPIVGLEHLIPNEIRFDAYDINTDNTFSKRFVKGQVLFGRRRAYQRKAAVAEFDGICSGDITVIEAIEGKIVPELLPFIIQTPVFFDYANRGSAGSLSPRVKWEHLADFEFELPPLEEQKVLADKLWAAYRLKEAYKKLLVATDEMVKSQFVEMFGNPFEINSEVVPLSSLCSINPSKPKGLDDSLSVSFIPMDRISEDGEYAEFETKPLKDVKKGFTYCAEDDVLFAKITPCMENGKGAILKGLSNGIGFGSTEFHVLRPILGISNSEWLYFLTKLNGFRIDAAKNMTGTGGQKRVPSSYLLNFKVLKPQLEIQREFAKIVHQADKSKSVIQKALVYLNDIQSDELGKIA
jgi:type I restriction enzyme S subunit